MGEYFKPWRRKLGLATLVLACVFAAGWIRCQAYNDYVDLSFDVADRNLGYEFTSQRLENGYCAVGYYFNRFSPASGNQWTCEYSALPQSEDSPMQFANMDWQMNSLGFCIGRAADQQPRPNQALTIIAFSARLVPYYSIVIPLTALSAFLLIANPKTAKSTKLPEPNPHDGA